MVKLPHVHDASGPRSASCSFFVSFIVQLSYDKVWLLYSFQVLSAHFYKFILSNTNYLTCFHLPENREYRRRSKLNK